MPPDRSSPRQLISSGSPFEAPIGFSRAVRVGERVLVAGTAPTWPDGSVDPDSGATGRTLPGDHPAGAARCRCQPGRRRQDAQLPGGGQRLGSRGSRARSSVRQRAPGVDHGGGGGTPRSALEGGDGSRGHHRQRRPRRRMTRRIIELDGPERIIASPADDGDDEEVILQVARGPRVVSVAIERQQAAQLAGRLLQVLGELERRGLLAIEPDTADAGGREQPLEEPPQVEFRVGTLTIGWDNDASRVVVEAYALVFDAGAGESALAADVEPDEETPDDDPAGPRPPAHPARPRRGPALRPTGGPAGRLSSGASGWRGRSRTSRSSPVFEDPATPGTLPALDSRARPPQTGRPAPGTPEVAHAPHRPGLAGPRHRRADRSRPCRPWRPPPAARSRSPGSSGATATPSW